MDNVAPLGEPFKLTMEQILRSGFKTIFGDGQKEKLTFFTVTKSDLVNKLEVDYPLLFPK